MKGYIYKIENSINNKLYIGQTRQKPKTRWYQHKYSSNKNLDNFPIHCAIRKYGVENFKFKIIETIEEDSIKILIDKLNKLEIKYIDLYKSIENGYNIQKGGHCDYIPKTKNKEEKYEQVKSFAILPKNLNWKPKTKLVYCALQLFDGNVTCEILEKLLNISTPTLRKELNIISNYVEYELDKRGRKIFHFPELHGEFISSELIFKTDLSVTTRAYLVSIMEFIEKC